MARLLQILPHFPFTARPVAQKAQSLFARLLHVVGGLQALDGGQAKRELAVQIDVDPIGISLLHDQRGDGARHGLRQNKTSCDCLSHSSTTRLQLSAN